MSIPGSTELRPEGSEWTCGGICAADYSCEKDFFFQAELWSQTGLVPGLGIPQTGACRSPPFVGGAAGATVGVRPNPFLPHRKLRGRWKRIPQRAALLLRRLSPLLCQWNARNSSTVPVAKAAFDGFSELLVVWLLGQPRCDRKSHGGDAGVTRSRASSVHSYVRRQSNPSRV